VKYAPLAFTIRHSPFTIHYSLFAIRYSLFAPHGFRVTNSHIGRVVLWMSGALVAFSAMALSVRGLADVLNTFEILTIRSSSGLLFLLLMLVARPHLRRELRLRVIRLHAMRNTLHFGSQVAWTKSITLLPLATVFALEFTTPAWVVLLAVVFLRERLTASRLATVLLGLAGVLVIVRPGLESLQPGALLALASAVGFAIMMVTTKKLTGIESTFAILFWMNLMQLPMNLAGADPSFVFRLEGRHLLPAAGMAFTGLASHYCLTNAFRFGDAQVVVPLDFLRLPLIAVAGWLLYRETIDPLVFAGAGLIIAGIVWNLRAEAREGARRG
jgi:drug/metabolite transporter (DMT)-like permease